MKHARPAPRPRMSEDAKFRLIALAALAVALLTWAGLDGGPLNVLALALGISGGLYAGRRL